MLLSCRLSEVLDCATLLPDLLRPELGTYLGAARLHSALRGASPMQTEAANATDIPSTEAQAGLCMQRKHAPYRDNERLGSSR